jgi:hypothetical protein
MLIAEHGSGIFVAEVPWKMVGVKAPNRRKCRVGVSEAARGPLFSSRRCAGKRAPLPLVVIEVCRGRFATHGPASVPVMNDAPDVTKFGPQ